MTDDEIRETAIEFAKRNKNRIARELTDKTTYAPDTAPVSIFMAGSPGAGKTEFSKALITLLEVRTGLRAVRIDNDEIRPLIPGYTGSNSYLFQGATTLIVEKMHDLALHNGQSFIMDNTFTNFEKGTDNIRRSLGKERPILIFYLYQKPEVAWRFTQAREATEGRNIPKGAFIEQFLGARHTVAKIIDRFGDRVIAFLVKKDFEKNTLEGIYRVVESQEIDRYIPEEYTEEKLQECL
ncbi:zeta toxin family protein [Candidatus Kaiserbacteria bacterium]|nr:zeta toxin family protein [Candidatus Kaiserbacteria bacterium]